MMIVAYDKDDHELKRSVAYSIGGGSIVFENESFAKPRSIIPISLSKRSRTTLMM